jgi:hypothetical protein
MNYQTTSFSKITLIIISLLLLPLFLTNAQSEKSMVKEKIKNIKGDIEKITITADGEEHVFSGEEAEELFKKLKLSKHKNISVKVLEGLDGNDKNIWVMKGDDDINLTTIIEDEYEFEFEEEGEDGESIKKEIKIEIEDGKKKVEVTTTKDGKESTEVFEGEEAEEFLKNSKHDKKFNIKIYDDSDLEWVSEGDADMIFLSEEMEGDAEIEKKVEVEIEDGVQKVTVTTTKDGKDEVKTYEGDEADKYLKKMNHGKHHGYKFFKSDDNVLIIDKDSKHKKMKKIIIKKEKDNDDKNNDDN